MASTVPISGASDLNINSLNNGRVSNRAARFYWADEEPSPMRSYSIQQIGKASSSDSHFEESPLVIAAIAAGVIGVMCVIIILVGIWIRSRLFTEGERRGKENPNNVSVRSSMSTLDEDAYAICMEMDGTVLGSMHNVADNYCANDATIEMEASGEKCTSKGTLPEVLTVADETGQSNDVSPTDDSLHEASKTAGSEMSEITESKTDSIV